MYKRVLLKLSGEALGSPGDSRSINPPALTFIAKEIAKGLQRGTRLALVGATVLMLIAIAHQSLRFARLREREQAAEREAA